MMARRAALGLLAVGLVLGLAGCGSSASRYHQKMTVEVETPEGVRTGSAVVEVGFDRKPAVLKDIPGNGFWVRGEAVAVELAPGKTLFALLSPPPERGSDTSWYQAMLFADAIRAGAVAQPPLTLPGSGLDVDAHKAIGRSGAKVTLPPQLYPLLVTFINESNPASVALVDPGNLAAAFGPNVALRGITVEVTDDPVMSGIEERLGWLEAVGRERSSLRTDVPKYLDEALPIHLVTSSDFSTELFK